MMTITNTNVRVGPGVYLALKHISDKTGMSMGAWANFLITSSLATNWKSVGNVLPTEIQTALVADFMSILGDLFKMASKDTIKNTSIADLYQKLLNPEKNPLTS